MDRSPVTVTKDMCLDHLYGDAEAPGHKIIDVFICRLRQKIGGLSDHDPIENVWGRGYKFVIDTRGG
jgi:two-component system cell cycle response regulator CtrA